MAHEFKLEENLCILSTITVHELLEYEGGSDAIALYIFYYYTAKWQKTNQPKATSKYCMKGLKWGRDKFEKANRILREKNLIEKIPYKTQRGKIEGWYIRINYFWSKNAENHIKTLVKDKKVSESPQCRKSHAVDLPECGFQNTNALNDNNINAFSNKRNTHADFSNQLDTVSGEDSLSEDEAYNRKAKVSSYKRETNDSRSYTQGHSAEKNQSYQENDCLSEKNRDNQESNGSSSLIREKTKQMAELISSFDRFYSKYPRKTGKQSALKAWIKLKPDSSLLNEILSAIEQHKKQKQWKKDNGQYIPHPATWLNQRRWEDEISIERDWRNGE